MTDTKDKPKLSWSDVNVTEERFYENQVRYSIWNAAFSGKAYGTRGYIYLNFSCEGTTAGEALKRLKETAQEQGWEFPEL